MRPRKLTPLLTPPLQQFSPPSPLTKLFTTTASSSLQPLPPPPPPPPPPSPSPSPSPSPTPTLRKCIALLRLSSSLPHLQQIHAHSIRTATPLSHPQLGKQLIFSLISLPSPPIPYAHRIFSLIPHPDIFTFNTLIRGYAESPDPRPALAVHRRLVSHPSPTASPDTHTYPFLLKACAKLHALRDGEAVHARSIINSFNTFVFVQNTLVHFYAACGLFEEAHQVFDGMSDRNLVTWNSVINGYAGNSRPNEALTLFHQMFPEQTPDGFTMVSLLSACAELGALALGRRVHVYIFKVGLNRNHHVGNSLIDLYAKCGTITDARRMFGEMRYKNVVSWTSLIVGLAANGCSAEALEMFEAMERENVAPSEITFVGVLYACSHHGLVDEGFRYFDKMKDQYRITPKIEHYGCVVDLLGRAGLVEEARDFIATMPLKPNAVLWRTLLGACATHKRVALGEAAWTELARLEPGHCGDYVLLSNIYATAGRWGEVHRLRRGMLKSGVRKKPGHSLFELGNCVHEFIMGDRSHPQCDEIYVMLEEIAMKLRVEGYMPVTVGVLADIEEEEKATALNYHSERLAIAFALLSTASGTPIRIVKNLRVCGDCHLVTKLISKIYGREIVVRDRSRFHHFRDGSCSCKDYW